MKVTNVMVLFFGIINGILSELEFEVFIISPI